MYDSLTLSFSKFRTFWIVAGRKEKLRRSKLDAIRALKRYLAREFFTLITQRRKEINGIMEQMHQAMKSIT